MGTGGSYKQTSYPKSKYRYFHTPKVALFFENTVAGDEKKAADNAVNRFLKRGGGNVI
jgi:hypothetical protein